MQRVRQVHFVGIGGCGMSGIAKVLHEIGYKVSGSDTKEGPNTLRLKDLGVKIYIGHDAPNVRGIDLLVYSSAVSQDNPELLEARANGVKILQRAEMLSWIMNQSETRIAVAGTHGKTTITAMLAKVFLYNRFNPTYFIGCDMDYVDSNAMLGTGKFSIAEADESDSSFLKLAPTVGVISNIEGDHLERFGNIETIIDTFERFADQVAKDGFVVIDPNDLNNQEIMKRVKARFLTYGLKGDVSLSAAEVQYKHFGSNFTLLHDGKNVGKVELSVPGWQNVLNSLAVFAVGFEFGLSFAAIAAALSSFIGARRRFQTVGSFHEISVIDDYAHHPTEVRATLSAARLGWPGRRIICIFQPHRYSRTMLLKDQFAQAFGDADKIIITGIYAASEKPISGITGKTIADAIKGKDVKYIPRKEKIPEYLMQEIKDGDMVLTLGAGDIYTIGKEIFSRLKMQEKEVEQDSPSAKT
ncbi:UDP-N-acetylmuramate--L-alanine ligase [candidate division WOR-1 bacterium RIFOXYB2_FULL_42_35]|uniref:UDP-N-acetylmuramate--L-alanine ligase n=1 Tax=candidate division WOR-1 bacterium RIFOXYC2_FULL_41_25 TaxID=1802586 RepID=A0A1F4TPX9_UNCSA|nr:MAG: UDP-N-acetylmuramate--L-alanine ligase [candidate division WOR-1 bacterium RIFOXYA2_FULL_41_14]OGC24517.1 MAG: UDP-N-acetylmuramate--L-alanine ligase [candidate division WOR-1 bacterium RIFOXYB2_FULL_42_35]OGC34133.1 MAG: UDP-N-acetylmuramate--L-alanine ligase [candidate division WOR-1 bacterium RIFOXYC2_FULL_41_25]OGC43092.1 MAG: UDP-N-acetylmuramate--L-alanine ligase [candidate division WOR-1 bacterium RIFOXYD2_FULL_41_8]